MAHFHDEDTKHACCEAGGSAQQSLDELDFERGIWGAAKDDDLERVKMHLRKGVPPDVVDSAGYTALHYAARNGHYSVCETLLEHGANVNAVTRSLGATPLHRAATQGHYEVIRLLLDHGADANIRDIDGKTPLHRVTEQSVDDTMQMCKNKLIQVTNLNITDNSGKSLSDLLKGHVDESSLPAIVKQVEHHFELANRLNPNLKEISAKTSKTGDKKVKWKK